VGKKLSSILNPDANEYPIRAFATIGHTHDDYPIAYATTAARDAITGSARYEGVIAYVVADQTTYQLRGGTENTDWVPLVTAIGGTSHTLLADIGTNTHAAIDTHIADATLHYAQAAISITESQISDLQSYSVSTHVHPIGTITGFTDNSTNWDLAFGWGDHSLVGYISGYTVIEGDVTAHQAALSITESQISDLQTYSVSTHNHDGSYIIPTDGVANRIPVFTAAAAAIGTSIFTWDGDIFTANKFILNNTLDRLTIGDGTVAVPGLEINAAAAGDPYINLQQNSVTSTILKFDDASARTELSSLADNITLRPGNVDTLTLTQTALTLTGNIILSGTVDGRDVLADGTAQDSHIADATIHFTEASISIPLTQGANDVTATAAEVNLLDLSGLTAGWVLSADTATTASWKAPTGGGGVDWTTGTEAGFHSLGIDDNATGEFLELSDTNAVFGQTGSLSALLNKDDTQRMVLSGGPSTADGANIILYGGTHVSAADDLIMRAGGNTFFDWDESAGELEISAGTGAKSLVQTITTTNMSIGVSSGSYVLKRSTAFGSLQLCGDIAADTGGNILLYGSSEATTPDDVLFRSGANTFMEWDESDGELQVLTGVGTKTLGFTFGTINNKSSRDLIVDNTAGQANFIINSGTNFRGVITFQEAGSTIASLGWANLTNEFIFTDKMVIEDGGILLTERADHSYTPAATFGEIWLKNGATQALMFTDDAGVDYDLTANSTDVTLAGTGTYLSLIGQTITVDPITESDISDLGAYITGYTVTEGDVTAHQAALAIAPGQITGLTATAAELNLLDLAGLTAGWVLSADTATTASWKAASSGDVSKSGTQALKNLATWQDDAGNLGGDTTLQYDQTADSLTIDSNVTGSGYKHSSVAGDTTYSVVTIDHTGLGGTFSFKMEGTTVASYSATAFNIYQSVLATGGVDKLTTATGVVEVASSAAPGIGQSLVATSSTAATWQDVAVVRHNEVLDTQTLNQDTERVEHTITLPAVPSHWNTWSIRGVLSVTSDEVTAATNGFVDSRIRLDSLTGTVLGRTRTRMSESSSTGATEASICYNFYHASSTTDPVVLKHTGYCTGSANDEDYRFQHGKIYVELQRIT